MFIQTLDNGLNVIQLETAVGAAIKSFEGAMGMLLVKCFFTCSSNCLFPFVYIFKMYYVIYFLIILFIQMNF